jgi:hypothetical protein
MLLKHIVLYKKHCWICQEIQILGQFFLIWFFLLFSYFTRLLNSCHYLKDLKCTLRFCRILV